MSRLRHTAWLPFFFLMIGCTQPNDGLVMHKPYFAQLLDVPNLVGEVVVSQLDKGGQPEEVGRGTLAIDGDSARAQLPGLPADQDLYVEVNWKSGAVTVADTVEPKIVRLERGQEAGLSFGPEDYVYPDLDGDGASNLYEVVFEAGTGQNAYNDSGLVPTGFFSGVTQAVALPGYPLYLQLTGLGAKVLVPTFDVREAAGGGLEIFGHQLHVFGLGNRERYSLDLPCSSADAVKDVQVNFGVDPVYSAVLCSGRVHFIQRDYVTQLELARSTSVPNDGSHISYGKLGNRLYLQRPSSGAITVLDSNPTSATYGEILEELDASILGQDAKPVRLVDTGDRLIITDEGREALVAVTHQEGSNYQLDGVALMGQLAAPEALVFHPAGHRLYVANRDDGVLRVVDIAPDHPIDWEVMAEVEVANQLSELAIEPVNGSWLYALTPHRIARIDTLTNQIGWQSSLGDEDGGRGVLYHLAISEDGMWGAIAASDARGVLVLGHPDPAGVEVEPNNTLSPDGEANRLGPPPALVVGYGDMEETGAVEFDHQVMGGSQMVDFSEDVEDLWLLDPGDATGRLAIALQPTEVMSRMNLTLVEPGGQIADKAIYPMQATPLSAGTGVFLVTPPLNELPEGTLIGVGTQDFDHSINYSHYELILIEVPATLRTVTEQEPNNNSAQAQLLMNLPVVLEGRVEGSDQGDYIAYGSEDAEDCYHVRVDNIRLGARLDFAEDKDIDLFVLNLDGSRWYRQYGMIGPGQAEFIIFEPHLQNPGQFLLCINIDGTEDAADYTLTLVDFDL